MVSSSRAQASACSRRRSAKVAQISGMWASENSLKEYSAHPVWSNTRTTKPLPPPMPAVEMLVPLRLMRHERLSSATASTEA